MRVRIEFPCRQYTDVRHWAIVDVSRYPETWRIIRSDVLETPILREFDPCTQLLLKGYTKYPNGDEISFYDVFYESICKSQVRLPQKGMVSLLQRMFQDDTHRSWDPFNITVKKEDHVRLVHRVIGKYVNSYERFALFVRWNMLSINNAFIKACLEINPRLTARIAYQRLAEKYRNGDLPNDTPAENALIEALLQPAGHRYLVRFFETRNHESIIREFLSSSNWFERRRALQYSRLAIVALDELENYRQDRGLQPLSPSLKRRAIRVFETVWQILLSRKRTIESAQHDFAAILCIPKHSLPRF